MKHIFYTIYICLFVVGSAFAQQFEIRAVNRGEGRIAVECRETSGQKTPGQATALTDCVFGLQWAASLGVDLREPESRYQIRKSGERREKNGLHFQAFYADQTPFVCPETWKTGEWVEIMSLVNTLEGAVPMGTFAICPMNFDETTDPNMGLDLEDFSPEIKGAATEVPIQEKRLGGENPAAVAFSLVCSPVPARENLWVQIQSPISEAVQLRVFDAGAKLLLEKNTSVGVGQNRILLDLKVLPAGNYVLVVLAGELRQQVSFSKI